MSERCLVLTENSTQEEISTLYSKEAGFVFKIEGDYEAVRQRIVELTPANKEFEVFEITPGTTLFSEWGPDHCVVVTNKNK